MPHRLLPTGAAEHPKPKAKRKFTDPESRIVKGAEGWIQGYNAMAAADGHHQVIVGIGASNETSDAVNLLPILERIKTNVGQLPRERTVDAGYCNITNIETCQQCKPDAYISHKPAAAVPGAEVITGTATERSQCHRPSESQAPL
jgi:hypothetical protein